MIKSAVVAKLLTLKAAVAAVAVVSAGGVALAATNVLATQNPGRSTPAPNHTNGSDATPAPSLHGLCTAYLAGAGAEHGKALESPAFTALITAAGGADHVDSYCAELGVAAPGSNHGNANPTDHPVDQPTHPDSTDHPTGQPSHATGPPTSHPGS